MNKPAPLFACPRCSKLSMTVIQKRDDNKEIQYECTGCLSWWVLKHHKRTEEDIRELAQCS